MTAIKTGVVLVFDPYAQQTVLHEAVYNAKGTWHDKPLSYWFQAMAEEFGELGAALNGEHEHSPETELKQIGAIAIGMQRQIDRLKGIDVSDFPPEERHG